MTQSGWSERLAGVIAGELRRHREAKGLSAQQLAEACTRAGLPMQRSVIANFENGRRASVGVAELLVFAHVLRIPPVSLICPAGFEDEVEILPGIQVNPYEASQWISGDDSLEDPRGLSDEESEEYSTVPIVAFKAFMEIFDVLENENDEIAQMQAEAVHKGVDLERAGTYFSMTQKVLHEATSRSAYLEARASDRDATAEDRVNADHAAAEVEVARLNLVEATLVHHRALELDRRVEERKRAFRDCYASARRVLQIFFDKGWKLFPILPLWQDLFEKDAAPLDSIPRGWVPKGE